MYEGSKCDRKSQLSEILTEPLKSTCFRLTVHGLRKERQVGVKNNPNGLGTPGVILMTFDIPYSAITLNSI